MLLLVICNEVQKNDIHVLIFAILHILIRIIIPFFLMKTFGLIQKNPWIVLTIQDNNIQSSSIFIYSFFAR